MANIQETIAKLCPQATFDTSDTTPVVEVPEAEWHALAATLKNDPALAYDCLITIVGMDWPAAFGCIYYLMSTKRGGDMLGVKVLAPSKEKPMIHSVTDLWPSAGLFEREVYDFFGIIFLDNPDMRRLFLSIDWIGYPLRKDFENRNTISTESERTCDFTREWKETPEGEIEVVEHEIFKPEDFVVNIGPQHPATHGVLRFRTAVDGETIQRIDVYMGYIHRGVEKLCESLTYPQSLFFFDRLDYFSAQNYHHGVCRCIERALGVEVPRRAEVIRVMMDELSRIASHCLFMGTFCMDLGATSMLFYTLRVREQILDIMEKTCGARMTFNYPVVGGVMQDLHPDFVKDVHALLDVIPANIKEYQKLFTGNVIAKERMVGVGTLSREDAIAWDVTGPSGRASGWSCDLRKTRPYSIYPELEFDEVIEHGGDAMARFNVRLHEIEQSARILAQLVDNIPEGDICAKVPKVIKLPEGHWFEMVEGCRGMFGIYIESDGSPKPYRMKIVPPCLPLAGVVDHISRGMKIADLITIGGSLDYIIPDMDR